MVFFAISAALPIPTIPGTFRAVSYTHLIEDGRDCSEVLIQIAAVRSAINNIGKIILEDHINHCLVDAIETGDEQVLKDLNEAINKFVK